MVRRAGLNGETSGLTLSIDEFAVHLQSDEVLRLDDYRKRVFDR
jgi:hypothetical protein